MNRKTTRTTRSGVSDRASRRIAVIGAGIAGIACARTLAQAGLDVDVFERRAEVGGRMATRDTAFGSFDEGAQYFTVRDWRFERALETAASVVKPWSANSVRVLDSAGRTVAAGLPARDRHWVAVPGMDALARHWAKPLAQRGVLHLQSHVTRFEADRLDPTRWQLHCTGASGDDHVASSFDAVLLALPAAPARELIRRSGLEPTFADRLAATTVAPCWTLLLAFPQAAQLDLGTLGPHWNAARSTHHRIAWLARESSKPGRAQIERWTVQASSAWSEEHLEDDPARVQAKLIRAFAEVTGIRAEPGFAAVHRWRDAQTTEPAGRSHLWDAKLKVGACGDWCIGHRVEDAFISGLELALAVP
ncbi:MAG: FAD-dependent oxidoreductase [Burkholderiales bacterium]